MNALYKRERRLKMVKERKIGEDINKMISELLGKVQNIIETVTKASK